MQQLSFQGKVTTDLPDAGYMWECPNYFEQDGRGVFIFSPQGELETDKYNFNNVFSVAYVLSDPLDVRKLHYEGSSTLNLIKDSTFMLLKRMRMNGEEGF